ncbi:hypothetical protein MTBLM1_100063 [Rhodospirillaceae bacterium LM-1]|nr:hypothetical protein MTBLM1_100063 [Rhodospirillaceae bacterium LM-1]
MIPNDNLFTAPQVMLTFSRNADLKTTLITHMTSVDSVIIRGCSTMIYVGNLFGGLGFAHTLGFTEIGLALTYVKYRIQLFCCVFSR